MLSRLTDKISGSSVSTIPILNIFGRIIVVFCYWKEPSTLKLADWVVTNP